MGFLPVILLITFDMYIRTRGCACVCVCVSVTVKSSCWAKMCNVASQAAITSSAPCLIYSQTLIRHMYINTLRCTSFIPCPHVHTNTFTIHLTATCSLCLSSHPHSLYPFYSQSHEQCCQALLGTVFVDVFVFFFPSYSNFRHHHGSSSCQAG